MPGGRPTKYRRKYCKIVIEKMKKGDSVTSCCAELGITRETFYKWVKTYQEFSDTYELGMVLAESWWEGIGKMGALGLEVGSNERKGRVQPGIFAFFMKNRFGWADRVEQVVSATVETKAAAMSPQERDMRLGELLAKANGTNTPDAE